MTTTTAELRRSARLYTQSELAASLGTTVGMVAYWIRMGRIEPPTKHWGKNGKRRYYTADQMREIKSRFEA